MEVLMAPRSIMAAQTLALVAQIQALAVQMVASVPVPVTAQAQAEEVSTTLKLMRRWMLATS